MNILFIHQNFPAQFKHLAPALLQRGHRVMALVPQGRKTPQLPGIEYFDYEVRRSSTAHIHPWLADFETKTIRAEAVLQAATRLRDSGIQPQLVIAHPGWGESLFVKDVWPQAKMGIYAEFHYQAQGADVSFDPEFPGTTGFEASRLTLKNLSNTLHMQVADAGISPTHWQASTFPVPFRDRITVVHDGIDTQAICPNPGASLQLNGQINLTRQDEIITFVNRNLEPYRGYHTFMRALPALMRSRPTARVLIVGGDDVSYGAKPPAGQSWKQIYAREAKSHMPDADWARVHFLGKVPYPVFVQLLQLSTVHVYLTYPFVLSWSLLEAMSAGCAIAASDTRPVQEVIRHGDTGRLFDFFDPAALTRQVVELLDHPPERARLGARAREFVRQHHDLQSVCLPRQLQWVDRLLAPSSEPEVHLTKS